MKIALTDTNPFLGRFSAGQSNDTCCDSIKFCDGQALVFIPYQDWPLSATANLFYSLESWFKVCHDWSSTTANRHAASLKPPLVKWRENNGRQDGTLTAIYLSNVALLSFFRPSMAYNILCGVCHVCRVYNICSWGYCAITLLKRTSYLSSSILLFYLRQSQQVFLPPRSIIFCLIF